MKQTAINLLKIIIWFAFSFAFFWIYTNTPLSLTRYQANDTPHQYFRVIIINADGGNQAVDWQTAQSFPESQWQRQPDASCIEDCLRAGTNGHLIYRNEGAGWTTESEYRIDGNRLIPISYRWFSMHEMICCMILSAMLVSVMPYFWRCWQYRHSKEQLMVYHRAVGRKWVRWGIWGLALVLLYWVTNWFQAA